MELYNPIIKGIFTLAIHVTVIRFLFFLTPNKYLALFSGRNY